MGKYGKKNKVSENLWDYNVCVLGESGIGKTTLMVETCEKTVGSDGYMIFNCGKEDGIDCLQDASYENIDTYKKFDEVTKDIIKNKDTDYPDLKIVVTDTLDQLFEIVEPEAVRRWNVENQGKKDFTQAKTLNQSWGGFGRGEEKVIEIILDRLWELKKVGVAFWCCGHVKTREIVDSYTGETYTSLSTNMMQKYFNGVKTKMHIVGIACIDREIIKESTGRKNVVTKKDITKNKVVSESRKIIFRDDNYGVDSKSRFAHIVDQIPLNSDDFIKALTDAVCNAKKDKKSNNISKKTTNIPVGNEVNKSIDNSTLGEENTENNEISNYPENLIEIARELFKNCKDKELKSEVRVIVKSFGKFDDVPEDELKNIYDKLK